MFHLSARNTPSASIVNNSELLSGPQPSPHTGPAINNQRGKNQAAAQYL